MSANREFDESQDRLVYDCGVVIEDDHDRLIVQIKAYGATGKNKIQVSRQKFDKREKEWVFAKAGRYTLDEFGAVARAVKAAYDFLTDRKQVAAENGGAGRVPPRFQATDDDLPF